MPAGRWRRRWRRRRLHGSSLKRGHRTPSPHAHAPAIPQPMPLSFPAPLSSHPILQHKATWEGPAAPVQARRTLDVGCGARVGGGPLARARRAAARLRRRAHGCVHPMPNGTRAHLSAPPPARGRRAAPNAERTRRPQREATNPNRRQMLRQRGPRPLPQRPVTPDQGTGRKRVAWCAAPLRADRAQAPEMTHAPPLAGLQNVR